MKMVHPIPPGELSFPVQCVSNPTGEGGVTLIEDTSYPISVRNRQPRDGASSVNILSSVQQQSSVLYNQRMNQVLQPSERLTSGGRPNAQPRHLPPYLSNSTWTDLVTDHRWRSKIGPLVVIALIAVILCLTVLLIRNGGWIAFGNW